MLSLRLCVCMPDMARFSCVENFLCQVEAFLPLPSWSSSVLADGSSSLLVDRRRLTRCDVHVQRRPREFTTAFAARRPAKFCQKIKAKLVEEYPEYSANPATLKILDHGHLILENLPPSITVGMLSEVFQNI